MDASPGPEFELSQVSFNPAKKAAVDALGITAVAVICMIVSAASELCLQKIFSLDINAVGADALLAIVVVLC